MTKLLIIGFLAMACVGCDNHVKPIRDIENKNKEVSVELVTEFDNIRLYRVATGERYVYVAAERQGSLSTMWDKPCGRGCIERVNVSTVVSR